MTPRSRWTALAGLAFGNLVPLFLVAQELMSTADLLLSYLVELLVLFALWMPAGVRGARRMSGKDAWKVFPLLILLIAWVTWLVLREVTWDLPTLLSVLVGGGTLAVTTVLAVRRSGHRVRFGAVAWRVLLIFTGAVIGLGTASNYRHLQAAGWEPGDLGSAWSFPFGKALVEVGVALGVPAVIIPALFVVLVRTLNEVLYEAYDILRDADVDRQGSREALATMHAQRQRQHQQARERQGDADQGG